MPMKKSTKTSLLAAFAFLAMSQTAPAHEFIVTTESYSQNAGQKLAVSLLMTETWIQPDRIAPADAVTLEVIGTDTRNLVDVRPGDKKLNAEVTVPDGEFVLLGSLVRDRNEKPRAVEGQPVPQERMTRSAIFSKTFVNLTASSKIWSRAVGSRLEIIPQSNPATLKPGENLTVQVLFDGKPVAARVQATFDGKGAKGHSFVVRTNSDESGMAKIPVDRDGLWLVRAKYTLDEAKEGYVHYAGGANIVFNVE